MWKAVARALVCAAFLAAALQAQTPDAKTQAGWQALQAGNADRAASLFYEALTAHPREPFAHFGAGVAAHVLGREEDAQRSLARALELNPLLTEASLLLGDIQYHLGDVDAAVRTYEKAVALAPGNAELLRRLNAWRKEASAERGMETWSKGSFSIVLEGRSGDRAMATRALDTLDAAYWRIGRALGAFPSGRIMVTLYTEQQFHDFTNAPDWSDGLFDGRIRMPVGGLSKDPLRFEHVLTHELVHAMIAGIAPRNVPGWLHEGLASYFEPVDRAAAERILKRFPIVPLSRLQGSFSQLGTNQAVFAYTVSVVAAGMAVDRLGPRTSALIQALGDGQSLESALTSLGVPYNEFDAAFRLKFGGATPR
jgi:tetratricopeptide (TPR) repeat protein